MIPGADHIVVNDAQDAINWARQIPYGSRLHTLAAAMCVGCGEDPNALHESNGIVNWQVAIVALLIERALMRELDYYLPDRRP